MDRDRDIFAGIPFILWLVLEDCTPADHPRRTRTRVGKGTLAHPVDADDSRIAPSGLW